MAREYLDKGEFDIRKVDCVDVLRDGRSCYEVGAQGYKVGATVLGYERSKVRDGRSKVTRWA